MPRRNVCFRVVWGGVSWSNHQSVGRREALGCAGSCTGTVQWLAQLWAIALPRTATHGGSLFLRARLVLPLAASAGVWPWCRMGSGRERQEGNLPLRQYWPLDQFSCLLSLLSKVHWASLKQRNYKISFRQVIPVQSLRGGWFNGYCCYPCIEGPNEEGEFVNWLHFLYGAIQISLIMVSCGKTSRKNTKACKLMYTSFPYLITCDYRSFLFLPLWISYINFWVRFQTFVSVQHRIHCRHTLFFCLCLSLFWCCQLTSALQYKSSV